MFSIVIASLLLMTMVANVTWGGTGGALHRRHSIEIIVASKKDNHISLFCQLLPIGLIQLTFRAKIILSNNCHFVVI